MTLPDGVVVHDQPAFANGFLSVKLTESSRYAFLKSDGSLKSADFEYASRFSERKAVATRGAKLGFIDKNCRFVVEPQFGRARDFSESFACVAEEKNGPYRFLNTKGQLVPLRGFPNAADFSEGRAAIESDDKIGFLDRTGKVLVKPQYDFVSGFSEGLSFVWRKGHHAAFVNRAGKTLISLDPLQEDFVFRRISLDFGRSSIPDKGSLSLLDKDINYRKVVFTPCLFREGLAPLPQKGRFGFIDKRGQFRIAPRFDFAFPFSCGRALVVIEGRYKFIDKKGNFLSDETYAAASSFSEGRAAIKAESDKWGYIDRAGRMVVKPLYLTAAPFSEGLAVVETQPSEGTESAFGSGRKIDMAKEIAPL